jgi:uncharacterized damage-inducible protein DinB
MTAEELAAPMADNMFLGALPRASFLHACIGHTSHHRGALSVYLRLLGKTPKMVYA